MTFEPLFKNFDVGRYTLPNRIVMAPMTRTFSPGGTPGADVALYYRRRVEGGVGLIITEGTWINHHAASNDENAPRFYGKAALAGWARVLAEVHGAGGRIMPQLWHTGLSRRPKAEHIYDEIEEDLSRKVSPSGYVMPGKKVGEEMSVAEAESIINAYAEGAETAERMGFDGVEIHGAHGYLVDQFFWHETNFRQDRFGGDLGARSAFGVEVVRACRGRVSKDFPVVLRFSQWKLQDYKARLAASPQELEALLVPLADAGVDMFHASQRRFWEPEFAGDNLNLAGWTKKITGKPSLTVGSVGLARELGKPMNSDDMAMAKINRVIEMLANNEVDLVAIGRALIGDAEWPDKIRRAAMEEIRPFNPADLASLH